MQELSARWVFVPLAYNSSNSFRNGMEHVAKLLYNIAKTTDQQVRNQYSHTIRAIDHEAQLFAPTQTEELYVGIMCHLTSLLLMQIFGSLVQAFVQWAITRCSVSVEYDVSRFLCQCV